MFLKNLQLTNFRNYRDCSIDFDSIKTLVVGENAQGKTNILEAVYYLSHNDSYRIQKDSELILWGESFCKIKGDITKYEMDLSLEVIINPPSKKILKVNDIKKTKSSDFLGNIVSVNFCVDDLLLIRGVPQDRRKWIDSSISSIYPAYKDRLDKYNKIRNHRNNILKDNKANSNSSLIKTLDAFDEQLIITGSNIIYLRLKYLKEIDSIAKEKHKIIAESENLSMVYQSSVFEDIDISDDKNFSIEEISKRFEEKLSERKQEELIRAQTLVGPHRDDLKFFINGFDALSFASQGQQRTIVLSLKLSELDIIKEKIDEKPVLLLDDVLAELDKTRQNFLLKSIGSDIQTIITSVDILSFEKEFLKDVKIYKVKDGKIDG